MELLAEAERTAFLQPIFRGWKALGCCFLVVFLFPSRPPEASRALASR